jgi:hypothetical protein
MVAVISTSVPADWRQAATPKHKVSRTAVTNNSTDRNWLTLTPLNTTPLAEERAREDDSENAEPLTYRHVSSGCKTVDEHV